MKKIVLPFFLFFLFSVVSLVAVSAPKGSSIDGTTGLIVSPTARIGWESRDFGFDTSYSFLFDGDSWDHIPSVNFSIFKKLELGTAMAIRNQDYWNLLLHGKFQIFRESDSALAVGLKSDMAKNPSSDLDFYLTPYVVLTYGGDLFGWPAATSVMLGWNMLEDGRFSSNLAFSMGFEISLFPDALKNYLFWIAEFSNYSYVLSSSSNSLLNADHRGAFNTGLRFEPVKHKNIKLIIDIMGTDLLDASRAFAVSADLGFGF